MRAAPLATFALGLLSACTGVIGESGQPVTSGGGGSNGGGSNGGGNGGSIGTGGGGPPVQPAPVVVPTPRMARLSHAQWVNTVRDLLGLADIADIEAGVTGDALVGFDNEAEALHVGNQLRADLADAAQKLAGRVTADAALLARLVPAGAPTDAAGKARAFITAFGQRAYRRPLTDAEVQEYVTLFNQGPALYPGGDAFTSGASLVLQLFLQSPHFLYRTELSTAATGGRIALDDYEVASKLSYALTNTMPDTALFAAAAAADHRLRTADGVRAEAARLLDSAAGAAGRDHFHFQVLRLGTYDGIVRAPAVFPDFTAATPAAMRDEVLAFTRWVFDQGGGVQDLYTAPVGFVNKTLAPLYGLAPAGFGDALTKVDLDPAQRSGLLTQAGFLSSYIIDTDPDSIHRGVFVNQRVLCVTLPPPDPNATALIPPRPDMTNRERVEATTGKGTCGALCHASVINPAGFAFEAFDAIGKFRTTDRGKPINAADSYPFTDGARSYDGAVAFSRAIADSAQAHECYTGKWLSYLNGRELTPAEAALVTYQGYQSRTGKLSMKELILTTVTAPGFLNRVAP